MIIVRHAQKIIRTCPNWKNKDEKKTNYKKKIFIYLRRRKCCFFKKRKQLKVKKKGIERILSLILHYLYFGSLEWKNIFRQRVGRFERERGFQG